VLPAEPPSPPPGMCTSECEDEFEHCVVSGNHDHHASDPFGQCKKEIDEEIPPLSRFCPKGCTFTAKMNNAKRPPMPPSPVMKCDCDCTYYRVLAANKPNSYFVLSEMGFYSKAGSGISTTSSAGTPLCSSTQGGGGCAAAFDGIQGDASVTGHWHSALGESQYVGFHFNAPTGLNGYFLVSAARYGIGSYVPNAWQLQGSTDGNTWQTIDDVTGYTWAAKTVTRYPLPACST